MNQTQATIANIDQISTVRTRRRPDPRVSSAAVTPKRVVYVRGWVAGDISAALYCALDDGERFLCTLREHRPDVAAALGLPGDGASEFEAFVEVPDLPDGMYRLTVLNESVETAAVLTSSDLRVCDWRPRTTLSPLPGGLLNVDSIRVGSRLLGREERLLMPSRDDLITIQGWVIDAIGARAGAALYAVIDDRDALPASYGRERDDVVTAYQSLNVLASGFRLIVDPTPYALGTRILRFVLVMDDGRAYACADSFAICVET
jgi:hypothetical protein